MAGVLAAVRVRRPRRLEMMCPDCNSYNYPMTPHPNGTLVCGRCGHVEPDPVMALVTEVIDEIIDEEHALAESIRAFVRSVRAAGFAEGDIHVRDRVLANELGVHYAPGCGAYVRGVRDGYDCHAVAGPDQLGNWTGLCLDGIVRQWTKDEIV
jgi:ribosomal protein S27AE